MNNKRINGVWIGPELTNIERLCIRSFQYNGHEFHLYTSKPEIRVPYGTIIHSVNEIVEPGAENWFCHSNHFSDYFRAHLINKIGGWYVDVDIVCLKHFDFPEPYAFVAEDENGGPSSRIDFNYLSGCIFKSPAGSPLLKNIIEEIESRNPRQGCGLIYPQKDINFGIGPAMFRKWVPKLGLEKHIQPPYVFDALNWHDYGKFVGGGHQWSFPKESYALHLRSSFWKGNASLVPNQRYADDSLYEQLKRKHGVQ